MENWGKLILRVSVGGLMLFHGIHKLLTGFSMIGDMLSKAGLPKELMYGVIVGEVIAPVLLILGWKARPAGAVLAFTMAMSVFLAFRGNLLKLNDYGALYYELNLLYFFGGLAVMFLGSGIYSISRGQGRFD